MARAALVLVVAVFAALPAGQAAAQTYHTNAQIGQLLLDAENNYPAIAQRHLIGYSYSGREMWAINISDNVGVEEDEPEFQYISTMHGDEILGVEMCLYLVDHLLTNYGTDSRITNMVDEIDIWIMPLMNPDGYSRSPRRRYNDQGYDLNRSFPEGSGSNPDPNTPAGHPTEVQVIMNWGFASSFTLAANFHGGEIVVNYPFDNDGLGSTFSPSPDEDLFVYISEQYSVHNTPMWNGPFYHGITNGAEWYSIDGGMQDWAYRYMGCNEVTIELDQTKEPSASLLPGFWDDNREAMLSYLETCLIGVRGTVTDNTGTPLDCTVTVVGRDHPIYTDPDVGDYHRMLLPGTYELTFEVDGQTPQTHQVVVSGGPATRLDVVFGPMPPQTSDVNAETENGTPVDITLAGSDANGDPLDFIITTLPAYGTLTDPYAGQITAVPYTLASGGRVVTYTDDDYVGTDGFNFKANDGGVPPDGGDSNVSSVYIDVDYAPPAILTQTLPDGYLGAPYGPVQLQADDGQPPLGWTVDTGTGYTESIMGSSNFTEVGIAQGWQGDDTSWEYTLPFTFPFYDVGYDTLRVNANGFVFFTTSFSGTLYSNTTAKLLANRMIAVLWDDLRTDRTGGEVYIDESVPGEVTIRWSAVTYTGLYPVNIALTLTADGGILFHYGPGNTNLTPTIGISNGDGSQYLIATYDGATSLTDADSVEFTLPGTLPPGISLSPAGILSGTPTQAGSYHPIFVVTDGQSRSDSRALWLDIGEDQPPTGDVEPDGDVDMADAAAFMNCMLQPVSGNCPAALDFTEDGTIDIDDWPQMCTAINGVQ